MLVRCINPFRHQISMGDSYLVIEILVRKDIRLMKYRIIDNEGCPAIYEADRFEIISNHIDNYAILLTEDNIILSHNLIINSELNKKNIDGFWGLYFEDDMDAKKVLKEVVHELALYEKISPPKLM